MRIFSFRTKRSGIFPPSGLGASVCIRGVTFPVCEECGFRGYREFIYQYEDTFREKKTRPFADNTKRVLDTYQELLNKAYNLADEKKFQKIAGNAYESGEDFCVWGRKLWNRIQGDGASIYADRTEYQFFSGSGHDPDESSVPKCVFPCNRIQYERGN